MEKRKILVVEDEECLLKLEQVLLRSSGYEVLSTSCGNRALAMLERQPVDLVLLDLMLPNIDGYEVCRRIKANPATAAVPVVMVTARNDSNDIELGSAAGADWYIIKPFKAASLLNVVARFLE